MAACIQILLQFNDWAKDKVPTGFSDGSSVWDMTKDVGLFGCKDYEFISSVSGFRSAPNVKPLFPLRGFPLDLEDSLVARLRAPDYESGWLFYSEIMQSLENANLSVEGLQPPIIRALKAMSILVESFGDKNVRMIFVILD